ncbi:MAG: sulfatase-like hydrolase/transferase [Pirellulaceae bacterium]|nr:sulfatase-like hydrolase/transferase [Pirellulaceae bacterium]
MNSVRFFPRIPRGQRRAVRIGCVCVWLFYVWAGASLQAADRQPNILFIFSDDHATRAISAYGSSLNQTPNLDRLATEGVLFRRAFCANSLCGPSRACILTGKHSHANGFLRNGNRFDASQVTLPKLLHQAGYQTAVIGKWHLETDPTGFDYWEVLPGQGHYYNPDFLQMDGSKRRFEGYCTDIITDKSIEWLKARDPNKPFLLMCQHKAPHRNWAPHPRHFDLYRDVPEPSTLHDDYSGRSKLLAENEMTIKHHFHWSHDMKFHGPPQFSQHFVAGMENGEYRRMNPQQRELWDAHYEPENKAFLERLSTGQLTDAQVLSWKYQRYIQDYLRCIQAVDESVGRLLEYLEQSGQAENTLVVYSSDQGFYLGEHGWYDKRWMFEQSLEMPLMMRWPGKIHPGVASTALVQNIDFAPTFLSLAGCAIPDDMQGVSFAPILENAGRAPSGWRDAIYYAYYENDAVHNVPIHDGVRSDRYKLMYFPRTSEWNLFDLQLDPDEMRSLHADPAYADILIGMKRRYHDLRQLYDVNSAAIPASRGDEGWWKQRTEQLSHNAQSEDVRLIFIGDSITQGWESEGRDTWQEFYQPRRAVNLGVSGDRTEHVLWRLTHGNLGKMKPKVAVLMIGTNNTGHVMQDPGQVAQGVRAILHTLAQQRPDTKVVLLGVFPRGGGPWDLARLNNVAINQYLQRMHDGQRVYYRDLSSAFLQPDGTISSQIMPDLLHLSPAAYRVWAEALEPTLKELGL